MTVFFPIFSVLLINLRLVQKLEFKNFYLFMDILCTVSSIGNLTALSIDRYFAIVTPVKHRVYMTKQILIIVLVMVWIYSICIASVMFIDVEIVTYIYFSAGFALPSLVIFYIYIYIFISVQRRMKNTSTVKNTSRIKKERKLAKTIFIVVFVFIICWSPYMVYKLYRTIYSTAMTSPIIDVTVKWLHYFNSCFNPFIYGIFNHDFKKTFSAMCTRNAKTELRRSSTAAAASPTQNVPEKRCTPRI